MKKILLSVFCSVLINQISIAQTIKISDTALLQPVEINSVRAAENTPIAKTTLNKKEIEKNNVGYDLPFILNQTPSVQVSSDAGNGIGYTGIRIRGTDASRINITINGIPYNDAESQGTFFVNLPDIASSANSIQIQRGVGTSTNGAGAFGGSVNINTNDIDTKKYLTVNHSYGSFYSMKNTLIGNSGLLNNHFIFSGRLSNISSNGYIDRAKSKLRSYFTSGVYVDAQQSLRLNIFSGKEKTQAAWFGINQATLDTNRTFNPAGTEKPGTPYDNESDNYTQTHYQLFYNRKLNDFLKINIAAFFTNGKGYFEQYKANQSFADYNLSEYISGTDTIYKSDLIRDLWLDNQFYGSIFSIHFNKKKSNLIIGGNGNKYYGKHFGEIVKATVQNAVPANYRWYDLDAEKIDFSGYIKWSQKINDKWQTFTDFQLRNVNYLINGFRQNPTIIVEKKYTFFNPKAGITYSKRNWQAYVSYSKAAKEPNRDDFETNINESPRPEKLHDFELGYKKQNKNSQLECNLFYMLYKDQLVLTGKVNNVYAYTRTNIPNSYRMGIELQGNLSLNKKITLFGNLTLSSNKVKKFTEYIDNYDSSRQEVINYNTTDISFSPSILGSGGIKINLSKNAEVLFNGKYVGKQYLDNTSNNERTLDDYFVQDIRFNYEKKYNSIFLSAFVQANNLFSRKYVSNGYTFSYIYGGSLTTENYYFPMATFNLMAGIGVTF